MRVRSKHVLGILLALLLVGIAFSPLFASGFVAEDWAVLADRPPAEGARADADADAPGAAETRAAPPLARLGWSAARGLCRLSSTDRHRGAPLVVHVLNLLLYLGSAPFLFAYARRLLLPWCGSEQARAAAISAALVFVVHPLGVPAVASAASLGELAGLVLSLAALALFLAGRQDRIALRTAASFLLCVLAGSASGLALGLPLALALSEVLSAHRYRPLRVRLRTAGTTLLLSAAAVGAHLVPDLVQRGADALPPTLRELSALGSWPALGRASLAATEKLGLLVLPSNPLSLGIAGTVLAGAVFLLVLQPALVGATSAPRLWGWVLFVWSATVLGSIALHPDLRLSPDRFALARALLPSIVPMSMGLGLAATALAGMRRWYLSWIAALGYAVVAHGNARPWIEASGTASGLQEALVAARGLQGTQPMLVIDPPTALRGVEPVGAHLAALLDPWIEGGPEAAPAPSVRGIGRRAFVEALLEPEGARWVAEGWTVLRSDVPELPEAGYRSSEISRGSPSGGPRSWSRSLASPPLDWEMLEIGALRVSAPSEADLEALRKVGWTTRRGDRGSLRGVWFHDGEQALGLFDLSSSLEWRLGGRCRSLSFQEGTQAIGTAEGLEELPGLGDVRPLTEADDWLFEGLETSAVAATEERGAFVLGILDLAALTWRELPLRVEGQRLRAPGAAACARAAAAGVAWRLEYRIDGLALARARGRT